MIEPPSVTRFQYAEMPFSDLSSIILSTDVFRILTA